MYTCINILHIHACLHSLLVSFCLRRQWSMHHGLVCGWVAVPALAVQHNPVVTNSVAVTAGVVCAWLHGCWCCPLPSAFSPHFPLILSLLTHLNAYLDDWPPTAVVCSYSFPACWIDAACLQMSFKDVFEAKNRPACRSGASGRLTIQHVPWDSSIINWINLGLLGQSDLRHSPELHLPEPGLQHSPMASCRHCPTPCRWLCT